MMMNRSSRRAFLSALGLGVGSTLLPSLLTPEARAQTGQVRRLLVFIQQHGTIRDQWHMRRGNESGAFSYRFDDSDPESFSTILRPLHAHRERLLVVEGLSQATTLSDTPTNHHDSAHLNLLTGAHYAGPETAGGPSFDQLVAEVVARPDQIPSLELATSSNPYLGGYVNSQAGVRVPTESDPLKVFQRVFPTDVSDDSDELSVAELVQASRASLLDFVAEEYAQVLPKLSREDREKLELHQDLIRDLETRLGATSDGSAQACPTLDRDFEGLARVDEVEKVDAFADLVAAAFACDRTRVASVVVEELSPTMIGAPASANVHQDIAHAVDSDPVARERLTEYSRVHAEMFRGMLDRLDAYGLLDSCACLWLTECATGTHELDDIPVVIAGSCGGNLDVGRYLSFAKELPNPHQEPGSDDLTTRLIGPGHNRLLVTLMNGMGVDAESLGETSLTTHDGTERVIDLTGALDELRS